MWRVWGRDWGRGWGRGCSAPCWALWMPWVTQPLCALGLGQSAPTDQLTSETATGTIPALATLMQGLSAKPFAGTSGPVSPVAFGP